MATVPDYLIPAGLRATSHVSRRKKRKQQQQQQQQQRGAHGAGAGKGTKKKGEDPLQSFALTADKLDGSGGASADAKVVAKRDPDAPTYALGRSSAGRNKWKQRHGKGQWKGQKKGGGGGGGGGGGNKQQGDKSKSGGARKRPRLPGDA